MGSGGGNRSSGISFSKPRPSKQPGRGAGAGGEAGSGKGGTGSISDTCDLAFETDLAGVIGTVTSALEAGTSLQVAIVQQKGFPTVVCRTSAGEIAGALANVEDLAQLISCIQRGNRYTATVRDSGPTYCTVFVVRD